jgi:BCD family chlorophyll transporter-like MFS transporter
MLAKQIQLGLIHTAVAMTLVPINSTLNRVMIKELALSATLVAALASLPYLFSPIQVAIGSFADRHPVFGFRRTPYILLGLLLCVAGVGIAPQAAYGLAENHWSGLLAGVLAFGAWGMGYNFAAVSYLSLASELSGEHGRGRTIAVMWFMMIVGIIITAIMLSRLVDPYTPQALVRSFWLIGSAALLLGSVGMFRLEQRFVALRETDSERVPWSWLVKGLLKNRQATLFFVYLVILLIALLGQDILLEPFAGEAFDMAVKTTTRITSLWGGFTLLALVLAGFLEARLSQRRVAFLGGALALAGFGLIAGSGPPGMIGIFYGGVMLLGLGTGLATVSNLSLMLDMTTAGQVGLFIGAWGMANAASRLIGSLLGGMVRDLATQALTDPVSGYVLVFGLEGLLLLASLFLLGRIDVKAFRRQAQGASAIERAALATD